MKLVSTTTNRSTISDEFHASFHVGQVTLRTSVSVSIRKSAARSLFRNLYRRMQPPMITIQLITNAGSMN